MSNPFDQFRSQQGSIFPLVGSPTFESTDGWDSLPAVIRHAHTLSTQTTLSFAEALSELTPIWESASQQYIRELQASVEEISAERDRATQMAEASKRELEIVQRQKQEFRDRASRLAEQVNEGGEAMLKLNAVIEVLNAPFSKDTWKTAHAKLQALRKISGADSVTLST